MKIGVVSGVYLNYPIDEAVRRIAAAGCDSIDIWSGRPHVYRRDFSGEELAQLSRLIADVGLTVSSYLPAFFRYPYSLSNPREVVRQDSVQYMRECLDNAAALGAPVMLIVPGRTLAGQSQEDGWQRLLDSIDDVCRYAEQYDIRLGLEAINRHACDLITTSADAVRAVNELGHPQLGVILDTGHMHLEQDAVGDALERTQGLLLQFHVNDNDGKVQQNAVPGEGTFDFAAFLAALLESGYDGDLAVELGYQYTADPDPAVELSISRLREWIAQAMATS